MIRTESLSKEYLSGGRPLTVLKNITFEIGAGEIVAIVGPSGSGKTTLLGLLAGLDRPSRGRVVVDGQDLTLLDENALARFRGERVGFVFQSFHLLPTLTARENVQVPLELRGEDGAARADELLARVGLAGRGHHYPAQLSGGEQQRVALARAFSNRPRILFADEPTGNLDGTTGAKVVDIMLELNRELGTTTVLVTHDMELARKARRIIRLADGEVVGDTPSVPSVSSVDMTVRTDETDRKHPG
jgi:putative ABC transport system ATP-binding protein